MWHLLASATDASTPQTTDRALFAAAAQSHLGLGTTMGVNTQTKLRHLPTLLSQEHAVGFDAKNNAVVVWPLWTQADRALNAAFEVITAISQTRLHIEFFLASGESRCNIGRWSRIQSETSAAQDTFSGVKRTSFRDVLPDELVNIDEAAKSAPSDALATLCGTNMISQGSAQ